ncbi:MAG: cytochrome c3 family protein [Deltaproteobacteria bacterium]|nr:MAG: cytochrome c3 family protein [Deltaproteobacteria bacterium]
MKKVLALAAILMMVAGGIALADVSLTPHNLSTGGTFTYYTTDGTDQECVFCHTPHGASAVVPVVLWNRDVPAGPFVVYSSDTMDAVPDNPPVGVSMACLSCHDGTVAFDALYNGPTAAIGNYDYDAAATPRLWTFAGGANLGGAGPPTETGADLSDDHPVSILLNADPNIEPEANVVLAGLPIYANQVECGSCHDPHDVTNPPFLRMSNAASALCTTCHSDK